MFYSLSDIQQVRNYSLKEKMGYFIGGIFIHIFLVVIAVMLILGVDELIVNYLNYPSVAQLFRESHHRIRNSFGILMIIIIGPILEEILFRLALLPKRRNLIIFSFIFSFFLFHRGFYPKNYDLYFGLSLLISILVVVLMFNLLKKYPQIEHFLQDRKKIIAIVSIIVFGLIHIDNIRVIYWELILFYPIFVLPQMLIGYFCSVLRLKLGFIWGVLFHSAINSIPVLLTIIS